MASDAFNVNPSHASSDVGRLFKSGLCLNFIIPLSSLCKISVSSPRYRKDMGM